MLRDANLEEALDAVIKDVQLYSTLEAKSPHGPRLRTARHRVGSAARSGLKLLSCTTNNLIVRRLGLNGGVFLKAKEYDGAIAFGREPVNRSD